MLGQGGVMGVKTDDSLKAPIVVRRCSQDYGLDKEGLVAVGFLVPSHDAEAPAARVAPAQHYLVTTVEVAGDRAGSISTQRLHRGERWETGGDKEGMWR